MEETHRQVVKNLPAMQETWDRSLDQEEPPGEGNGYPCGASGKELTCQCRRHKD